MAARVQPRHPMWAQVLPCLGVKGSSAKHPGYPTHPGMNHWDPARPCGAKLTQGRAPPKMQVSNLHPASGSPPRAARLAASVTTVPWRGAALKFPTSLDIRDMPAPWRLAEPQAPTRPEKAGKLGKALPNKGNDLREHPGCPVPAGPRTPPSEDACERPLPRPALPAVRLTARQSPRAGHPSKYL